MAVSGLGQDGYVRFQKEVSWGSGVTNSMTFLPILPGANFKMEIAEISNANVIASRVKQLPDTGRHLVGFTMSMNLPFTLIGAMLNLFLGASSDSGPTDSAYVHTWLTPITGERISKSFTLQVAKGGDTANQFVGAMITRLKISGDNQAQVVVEMEGVAKSFSTGVSRANSFSYPSVKPANFGMVNLNIDPANGDAFDQPCNSFEFEINLNYDVERFKTGSVYTYQPVFNGIPELMLKANVDADKQFEEAAQAHTLYDLLLTFTSPEYAGGTTPYKLEFEIPKAKLKPEVARPFENDRLAMDLDFDCGYGGTTTGSSSAIVAAEARVTDATTAYA